MIQNKKIKYNDEIKSNHREYGWLLPKEPTCSNLSLNRVFKKWN